MFQKSLLLMIFLTDSVCFSLNFFLILFHIQHMSLNWWKLLTCTLIRKQKERDQDTRITGLNFFFLSLDYQTPHLQFLGTFATHNNILYYSLVRMVAGKVNHIVQSQHARGCLHEVLGRINVIYEAQFLVFLLVLWAACGNFLTCLRNKFQT